MRKYIYLLATSLSLLVYQPTANALTYSDVSAGLDAWANPGLSALCTTLTKAEGGHQTMCRRVVRHTIAMTENPNPDSIQTWVSNTASVRSCNVARRFVSNILGFPWVEYLQTIGTVGKLKITSSRYECT